MSEKEGEPAVNGISLVKVEDPEGVNEIQTYLQTFNKEIQGGEASRDGNTYYVDANGQFYYSQRVVCVGQGEDANGSEDGKIAVRAIGEATGDEQAETVTLTGDGEPMLINTGGQYGTVTILPQESNGELRYVLFMPAEEGKAEVEEETTMLTDREEEEAEDQDLRVYDFDEEAAPVEQTANESEVEEEKPKIVKMPKKNLQNISSAHMCNYCNYISPKRYLLSRHMKSHSDERPHKCSVCERGFKTLASLQNHVNTHTGTKPHECRFCESSFTTSGELVRHVRYRHTKEKPHKCTQCDYASVELSKLRNHIRCHTGERPYQCPHCTYASPDTFKLKRHLRIHTGEKPYECEVCHARFTQSNSLKGHRLIHSVAQKPVFRCELCPATCGRKTDLRIHVQKLHTSDRLIKCIRCGKTFPDRYTYKIHSKTHDGEKCFRCGLCPYASTSARHLESHMLIHTDQKPYACDLCDQSFRQKQLLKRHKNLYHTPNYIAPQPREKTQECPECGRSFRHKGNLIRHMAVHDPDSSTHERQMALKIGRQKKVQFIDGQQVELMSDEEEPPATPGMMVSDANGQPYVVLEVIQLADGTSTEFVMAADENSEMQELEGESPEEPEEEVPALEDQKKLLKISRKTDKPEGMDDCFGFGEDDEDNELEIDKESIPTCELDTN